MERIVKYDNDFNNQALRKFTSEELNILMTIFYKLKKQNTNLVEYSFYELKRLIKLEKNMTVKEFSKVIMNVNQKLLALNYTYITTDEIVQMTIFKTFKIKINEQKLIISLNEDFKFLLNDFNKEWTRFELEEFVNLKSSYTKEFYRRMKQFRKTGFWKCNLEDFKRLLDIPEKYRIIDIDTRVLTPIQKELEQKYNLEITKKYGFNGGRGRSRVVGFEFKFSPEKREKSKLTKKDKSEKSEKKEKPEQTQEKEKTLREKIKEKIVDNNGVIENMEAFHKLIKYSPKLKDSVRKLVKKIEELKSQNVQLKAIYDIDEENFTQEIVDLANELIIDKI